MGGVITGKSIITQTAWHNGALTGGSTPATRRKLLLLSYYYPPSSAAGAARPFRFAKYLGREGMAIRVLTASAPSGPSPEVVYVRDPASPLVKHSLAGITHMVLRKLFLPFEDSVIWARPAFRAAEQIVKREPGEWAVLSTFPPVSTHLAAWWLRRRYGLPWIADFRDPLAGSPSRKAMADLAGPIPPRVDAFLEDRIFRSADVLIANTDVVASLWRQRYPAACGKIHHIWNGFDPEQQTAARPIPPRPFRVILHAGTIYQGRHPGLLLDSLNRLVSSGRLNPNSLRVRFLGELIPGTIPNTDVFEKLAQTGCVEVVPSVSRPEALRQTEEADALLLIDLNDGLQLPSKVFEYIRIGRPVLALTGRDSPADRVLRGSGIPCSFLYPDSSSPDIDEAVLQFLSLSSEPVPYSAWFEENFSAVRHTAELAHLVDQASRKQRV